MARRANLEPGSQLGRYELLTPIAQGGMAEVWAARQSGSHGFKKTVALKTMLPDLGDDPQFERMFLAEGRNAMRIHHPNVAEILDLGEEEGLVYLVMEWVDGESVSTLLKTVEKQGSPVPMRLGVYLCLKACLGLHAAHEVTDEDDVPLSLVHRDVSPQNVMVTYGGHVQVVDFGVAKSQMEGSATLTGQFKGKVPYMAPEQAVGDRVDRRTDVFAMGTMLYRITVGAHPFGGASNQVATLHNIIHVQPTRPTELDPSYPADLEAIVLRCLGKERNGRFASMADVARGLEKVLTHLGPPVTEQELATFVKTHLGELRVQRRAAMRDAAKNLGWAVATSESLPRISVHTPPPRMPAMTPSGATTFPGPGSLTPSLTRGSVVVSQAPPPARPAWLRWVAAGAVVVMAALAGALMVKLLSPRSASVSASSQTSAVTASTNAPPPPVTASAPVEHAVSDEHRASAPTAQPSSAPEVVASPRRPAGPAHATPPPGHPAPPGTTRPQAPSSWGAGPDLGF